VIHIIDDDSMVRETIVDIIESTQFDCLSFESGEHYLDYMNSPDYQNPIVVVSDVKMLGINGYDLTLRIRERHPFQKIVLISGESTGEFKLSAEAELCHYLFKPFNPGRLIDTLNTLASCGASHQEGKSNYPKQCHHEKHRSCPLHCEK